MTFKAGIVFALFSLASLAGLLHCGYLESAVTPVDPTPTSVTGRVVDALSKKGIAGVTLTLKGTHDTVLVSGENGLFNFSQTSTGSKVLVARISGYLDLALDLDLKKSSLSLDTLFLVRVNRPPALHRVYYPRNIPDIPLSLRFKWSFSDTDYTSPYSIERVRYWFYFGTTRNPVPLDSGMLMTDPLKRDTMTAGNFAYIATLPDTFLSGLLPDRTYYWRIVIKDIFGDSSGHALDSFHTRKAYSKSCSTYMALIEKGSMAFCMDKYEFSYKDFYERYLFQPDSIPSVISDNPFSPTVFHPMSNISYDSAQHICERAGNRLCTISEWQAAIGGYNEWKYPYGNSFDSTRCYTQVPIINALIDTMSTPGTKSGCISEYGVYDLSGNVAEWVNNDKFEENFEKYANYDPREGDTLRYQAGGYWASHEDSDINSVQRVRIEYNPKAFSIGFRCCRNIKN